MHLHLYICIYIYMYMYIYTYRCLYKDMNRFVYTYFVYMQVYIYICIHIYIYICIHISVAVSISLFWIRGIRVKWSRLSEAEAVFLNSVLEQPLQNYSNSCFEPRGLVGALVFSMLLRFPRFSWVYRVFLKVRQCRGLDRLEFFHFLKCFSRLSYVFSGHVVLPCLCFSFLSTPQAFSQFFLSHVVSVESSLLWVFRVLSVPGALKLGSGLWAVLVGLWWSRGVAGSDPPTGAMSLRTQAAAKARTVCEATKPPNQISSIYIHIYIYL